MKKLLGIFILVFCCVFIIACDNSENNTPNEEHQHRWSEPICEQKQICLICGKAQATKIEHEWSDPVCEQKQVCSKCNEESQNVVSHTTERGTCGRCGEYYISKENQIADENTRHENKVIEIYNAYSTAYDNYDRQANTYYAYLTHSESYVSSQISSLNSQAANLQTKISIAQLDTSASGRARVRELQNQLSSVQNQLNGYLTEQSYWRQYNTCIENLNYLNSKYDQDIAAENQLHEQNLAKINA